MLLFDVFAIIVAFVFVADAIVVVIVVLYIPTPATSGHYFVVYIVVLIYDSWPVPPVQLLVPSGVT